MTSEKSLFKTKPLTPEQAAEDGYEKLDLDLGDPALSFSTYVRKKSLFLRRENVGSIARAGVGTLATIYVPEAKDRYITTIVAYAFDHAIEAQPCADHALVARGYAPLKDTEQQGLLVGGGIGLISRNGIKVRAARSYALVRGTVVLVAVMEFPIAGSDDALQDTGAFISNIAFDDGTPPGFHSADVAEIDIPLPKKPFELAYPANWTISADGFKDGTPPGSVLFAVGDPTSPNGLMTFGFREDRSATDKAALDASALRIAEQYVAQNRTILGEPKLEAQGALKQLGGTGMVSAFFFFHLDNLKFHRKNQIRVIVVADGDRHFTLSLLTDVSEFEDFGHFLVYATGITAHDMMVDALLRYLVGRGM